MKKDRRVDRKSFSTAGPRPQQGRSRSTIRGLLIAAFCFTVFIGVLGIASAAQNNNGPLTLGQKMQGYQQRIKNSRAHPHPEPSNQNQAPPSQAAPTRQSWS